MAGTKPLVLVHRCASPKTKAVLMESQEDQDRKITKWVWIGGLSVLFPGPAAIIGGGWLAWKAVKAITNASVSVVQRRRDAIRESQEQAEQLIRDELWQRDRERREREQAEHNRPPSRDEVLAAARERYESTLRMLETAGLDEVELTAARARAKQKLLRQLDGLMQ